MAKQKVSDKRIYLFRVRLNGDYDDGGAYWGGTPAKSLYCARTSDGCTYRAFVRANSRKEAAQLLEIPNRKLIKPVKDNWKFLDAVLNGQDRESYTDDQDRKSYT
jgi:hypothetical protein